MTQPETRVERSILVVAHALRHDTVIAAERVVNALLAAGARPVLAADDCDALAAVRPSLADVATLDDVPVADIELAIVLGGDGTILRGAEKVITSDTPLLGVNLGHVGFLAEAEAAEIDSIVEHVVNRTYTVEERFTIDVTLRDHG